MRAPTISIIPRRRPHAAERTGVRTVTISGAGAQRERVMPNDPFYDAVLSRAGVHLIIDLHGDEPVIPPPDPFDVTKGDPVRSDDGRDGSRSKVDSRQTVAMRYESNPIVSSGGHADWFLCVDPHDTFEGRSAGTKHEQLRCSRIKNEHGSGLADCDIDERHWFEINSDVERSQRPPGDQVQPVQRARALGRGACYP